MRPEQITLVNALRDTLNAPLDELLFMVNHGLGIPVSRATLNRYLRPAHQRLKPAPQGKQALKRGAMPDTLTLHYRRLAMVMDDGGDHHLLWAREPVSGWCHARVYSGLSLPGVLNWLDETLERCPANIQCLETEKVKWLDINKTGLAISHQIPVGATTLNLSETLQTLIPAATTPDALAQQLSELWNTGKTQKKLGDCTPQAFLEALRR